MRARLASALLAAGAAALSSATASAFVRSRGPSSEPGSLGPTLQWCTREPSFAVNDQGSDDAGAEASIAAVRRSFATWEQTDCSDLAFVDQGNTARFDVGYDPQLAGNQNLVVWREVLCDSVVPRTDSCLLEGGCNNQYGCWDHAENTIALTTTSYDNRTGEILDSDIELNGAGFVFTTVDAPPCERLPAAGANDCVATDVQNTVTHEIGHLLGLDHAPDPNTTMYASEAQGETKKRDLDADDVEGVCTIYPEGTAEPGLCSGSLQDGSMGGGGGGQAGGCGCGAGSTGFLSVLALLALFHAVSRRR